MIETADQVEQFLKLQAKDKSELQAICEGMGLNTEGTKADLIDRLASMTDAEPQQNILKAQAIPLRTRNSIGNPIDAAVETFKKWRKLIFETKGNLREFQLLNGKGKSYTAKLYYIKCSNKTAQFIIEKGWYLPHSSQRDLINMLQNKPENFYLNIIQKPGTNGNSWLMLHCEARKAA